MLTRLSRETFRSKIYDYSEDKEWKFRGDKPTILTFYLRWFEACKVLLPILEEISKREDIDVYKVDVDQHPELAGIFGIEKIPMTLFIDKDGNINGAEGALTKESVDNLIEAYLINPDEKAIKPNEKPVNEPEEPVTKSRILDVNGNYFSK